MKFTLEFCPICYDILSISDETQIQNKRVEFQKTYQVKYEAQFGDSSEEPDENNYQYNHFNDEVCRECRNALSKAVAPFIKAWKERVGINQKKIDISDLHNWEDVEHAASRKKSVIKRLLSGKDKLIE